MARLKSSGFELNSSTNAVELETGGGTVVSTPIRSGTYAGKVDFHGTFANTLGFNFKSAAANGPFYFRFYLYITTTPGALTTICFFHNASGSSGHMLGLKLTTGRALQLFKNNSQVGSDSSALSTGTWYRIELGMDRTPGAGSQTGEAKIDGTTFASASNITYANGVSWIQVGSNMKFAGASESNTTGELEFDDLAINDSSGSFQNSYPGEGEIIHLRPNAVGDNSQWTTSTGIGDKYTFVDEVTPDDATTYNYSFTTGNIDDYNIDATPAALDTGDTINCVQVGVRFRASFDGFSDSFVLRIKASASGTTEESADIASTSTSYVTNALAAPKNYALTLYDLPGASTTAWTKADLDTTQIGLKKATEFSGSYVSTLWLLVDHKPAEAPAGGSVSTAFMTTNTKFWG